MLVICRELSFLNYDIVICCFKDFCLAKTKILCWKVSTSHNIISSCPVFSLIMPLSDSVTNNTCHCQKKKFLEMGLFYFILFPPMSIFYQIMLVVLHQLETASGQLNKTCLLSVRIFCTQNLVSNIIYGRNTEGQSHCLLTLIGYIL